MGKKLTKLTVATLKPVEGKDVFEWDGELRGFGVRVKPSGVKTFIIQYRNERGQTRRYAIGQYGRLTVEDARRVAKIKLGEVEKGKDPSGERKKVRTAKTVKELCEIYYRDAVAGKVLRRGMPKKASTLAIDSGRINRHIIPLIGEKALVDVTRNDVERFMHDVMDGVTAVDEKTGPRGRARVTGGPGTAAKAINLLGAVFNYGIKRGWCAENPCKGIERPADNKKVRHLNSEELAAFGAALREARDQGINRNVLLALEALALTGCRKSEITSIRGREIDTEGHCLRLEDTKTGSQLRPCGGAALDFLKNLSPDGPDEFLFPAARGDGHVINIAKPLAKVCGFAKLKDVTAHVLRHTYATTAHELQYSELTIAGLLGHSAGSVTARYAHHVDKALATAADHVSATIAARMAGMEGAKGEVIPFRGIASGEGK